MSTPDPPAAANEAAIEAALDVAALRRILLHSDLVDVFRPLGRKTRAGLIDWLRRLGPILYARGRTPDHPAGAVGAGRVWAVCAALADRVAADPARWATPDPLRVVADLAAVAADAYPEPPSRDADAQFNRAVAAVVVRWAAAALLYAAAVPWAAATPWAAAAPPSSPE